MHPDMWDSWSWLEPLADHLWQSTCVLMVLAALTLALRTNRATVRYSLWLVASIKFLVPFAALIAIGRTFHWPGSTASLPPVVAPAGMIVEPFSQRVITLAPRYVPAGDAVQHSYLPLVLITAWAALALFVVSRWVTQWLRIRAIVSRAIMPKAGREIDLLRALERRTGARRPLPVMMTSAAVEPGVFGVFRPVLVWPSAISACLDDLQMEAILAHELAHVRRHDNLTALMHMSVQALFWFHPLVWLVGARLSAERERACDEAVVQLGSDPRIYSESILQACRLQLERTMPCAAGVTGAELCQRIEQIMSGHAVRLTMRRKLLLTSVGVLMLAVPVLAGVLQTSGESSPGHPAFEVASIRENTSNAVESSFGPRAGRFRAVNTPLLDLLLWAYDIERFQLEAAPDWVSAARFDIDAMVPEGSPARPVFNLADPSPLKLMLQTLLVERFNLVIERRTKESRVYELVLARSDGQLGPGLTRSTVDCEKLAAAARLAAPPAQPPAADASQCFTRMGAGVFSGGFVRMIDLAWMLSPRVDHKVIDRTGLPGRYAFTLTFTPSPEQLAELERDVPPGIVEPPVDPNGPSIFAALQEQLGLRLESRRAPVETVVIKSIQRPSSN
jgi:uncharacterized protein (TIGR03435 family)